MGVVYTSLQITSSECNYLIMYFSSRRAQLRNCLEVLRQHVPLPDKLTTLALLQSAKKYIEVEGTALAQYYLGGKGEKRPLCKVSGHFSFPSQMSPSEFSRFHPEIPFLNMIHFPPSSSPSLSFSLLYSLPP